MNVTNIFLIRHGDVDNPQEVIYDGTISLSELGKQQLRLLGQFFRENGIIPDAVVSSPYLRTMQSSLEILSNYSDLNIPLEQDSRLQDPDFPDLVGKPLSWVLDKIVDPYTHPDMLGWRIERPQSFTARMMAAINDVLTKYKSKTVFIVSHGDPTAFAMWQLLHPGMPLPSIRELRNKNNRFAYLEKGEAWKIVFDEQGRVVDPEHVLINKISLTRSV
jgi:broad specificity phosphatase PhoE